MPRVTTGQILDGPWMREVDVRVEANTDAENRARVKALVERGVEVILPATVEVAPEVDPARIAGEGVTLHPGCRLRGRRTWIGAGVALGAEAPVTIEDCQLGARVALAGGFFRRSTFLEGASMGSGAHVREACLLEEEASGAHAVGLKQTLLFPFVKLGSLINFCDCLMAGGTSRRDHSEVGSAYIHFNYSPHQDKATASLFGDVPRGVMLDRPPIFLGGQGGAVGPLRIGFGTIAAAGTILRRDLPEGGRLVGAEAGERSPGGTFTPGLYRGIERIVRRNVDYIANLHALRLWYGTVRRLLFSGAEEALLRGAIEKVDLMLAERVKRFRELGGKMSRSVELGRRAGLERERLALMKELGRRWTEAEPALVAPPPPVAAADRDRLLAAVEAAAEDGGTGYVTAIQRLGAEARAAGTRWLEATVEAVRDAVRPFLPSFSI